MCEGEAGVVHSGYFGLLLLLLVLPREWDRDNTPHWHSLTLAHTHTHTVQENFAAFWMAKKVNGKSWKLHTELNWERIVGRLTRLSCTGLGWLLRCCDTWILRCDVEMLFWVCDLPIEIFLRLAWSHFLSRFHLTASSCLHSFVALNFNLHHLRAPSHWCGSTHFKWSP